MSKFTSLIKARFESVAQGQKEKQKGVSALEYLVLAAVVVIAIGVGASFFLGSGQDSSKGIGKAFSGIADCIGGKGACGDGGGGGGGGEG